jgi:hypothetical protein
LWNARIACNQGLHATVLEDLEALVAFGGSAGAEAQYLLAEEAYNRQAYDRCETTLFSLIETFYQQEKWRNKGFLLLVSTYIGIGDLFQARATAESILANVQDPNIQETVSDLLFEIDALESAPQDEEQPEEVDAETPTEGEGPDSGSNDNAPTPENNDE